MSRHLAHEIIARLNELTQVALRQHMAVRGSMICMRALSRVLEQHGIEDGPRHSMSARRSDEPSVEVPELVLRPLGRGEVVPELRLLQIADAHREFQWKRLRETALFLHTHWALLDDGPRAHSVGADFRDLLRDALPLRFRNHSRPFPRRQVGLHLRDLAEDVFAKLRPDHSDLHPRRIERRVTSNLYQRGHVRHGQLRFHVNLAVARVHGQRLDVLRKELVEEVSLRVVVRAAAPSPVPESQHRLRSLAVLMTLAEPLLEHRARQTRELAVVSKFSNDEALGQAILGQHLFDLVFRQPVELRVVHVHRLLTSVLSPSAHLRERSKQRHDKRPTHPQILDELVLRIAASAQDNQRVFQLARPPGQMYSAPELRRRHQRARGTTSDLHQEAFGQYSHDAGTLQLGLVVRQHNVHDVVLAHTLNERHVLLQVADVLGERNDVLAEARQSRAGVSTARERTDADLHVVQRHQHGLEHRGLAEQVLKLHPEQHHRVRCGEAGERVLTIPGTEARHAFQQLVLLRIFKLLRTLGTDSRARRRLPRRVLRRHVIIPRRNSVRALLRHLEVQVGREIRVKSREADAAFATHEEHEVTHDVLHRLHRLQRFLTEGRVHLGGPKRREIFRRDRAWPGRQSIILHEMTIVTLQRSARSRTQHPRLRQHRPLHVPSRPMEVQLQFCVRDQHESLLRDSRSATAALRNLSLHLREDVRSLVLSVSAFTLVITRVAQTGERALHDLPPLH